MKRGDSKDVTLHLLSGKDVFNLESLVELFEALTGRRATPEEIEQVRNELRDLDDPGSSGS